MIFEGLEELSSACGAFVVPAEPLHGACCVELVATESDGLVCVGEVVEADGAGGFFDNGRCLWWWLDYSGCGCRSGSWTRFGRDDAWCL